MPTPHNNGLRDLTQPEYEALYAAYMLAQGNPKGLGLANFAFYLGLQQVRPRKGDISYEYGKFLNWYGEHVVGR